MLCRTGQLLDVHLGQLSAPELAPRLTPEACALVSMPARLRAPQPRTSYTPSFWCSGVSSAMKTKAGALPDAFFSVTAV